MKQLLEALYQNQTLEEEQAAEVIGMLAEGAAAAQVSALLSVLRTRSLTLAELAGFRRGLRERALAVDLSAYDPIDVCGTGGDGRSTFNISTAVAFVLAGAGVRVAKHGNHGVSSFCGSSTVLEALGCVFTSDTELLTRQIETAGVCFLHAPLFHPALKGVAVIRRELGVRTFFNLLGPLVNPVQPRRMLIGVADLATARLFSYLLERGDESFCVVHSLDGFDEISLGAPALMRTREHERYVGRDDFGLPRSEDQLPLVRNADEGARILLSVLSGDAPSVSLEVVCANAAAALECVEGAGVLAERFARCRESIRSGAALSALKKLIALSK